LQIFLGTSFISQIHPQSLVSVATTLIKLWLGLWTFAVVDQPYRYPGLVHLSLRGDAQPILSSDQKHLTDSSNDEVGSSSNTQATPEEIYENPPKPLSLNQEGSPPFHPQMSLSSSKQKMQSPSLNPTNKFITTRLALMAGAISVAAGSICLRTAAREFLSA
jgi:hypothetical protein